MILKPLYEVPRETGDPEATLYREEVIRLKYYRDGERRRGGIRFLGVGATLTRADRFVPFWLDDAYYTLVEVEDSAWLEEMLKDVLPNDLPIHATEAPLRPFDQGQWRLRINRRLLGTASRGTRMVAGLRYVREVTPRIAL
jgi:hypothetical protein